MQRRELLAYIATLTGCTFVAADDALALNLPPPRSAVVDAHIALLDEIAETILPRTDTPGAKDAQVGAFAARYSAACYDDAQLTILRAGLVDIDARSQQAFGADFIHASRAQREALLVRIDAEAKRQIKQHANEPPHYFILLKQLSLLGFFTSQPGATKVARYRPIPGPYKGVVTYKKGEAFWS